MYKSTTVKIQKLDNNENKTISLILLRIPKEMYPFKGLCVYIKRW